MTRIAALLIGLFGLTALPALAEWVRHGPVEARLITATTSVAPGSGRVSAALHLRLDEGWKTYWRSPGEVGLPPELTWRDASNVADARIVWPAPQRFEAFGIENYGYDGEVALPLEIALTEPGAPTTLAAEAALLVCREVCVPAMVEVSRRLGPGAAEIDAEAAALIADWAARAPGDGVVEGLTLTAAGVRDDAVSVTLRADPPVIAPDVFLEVEGVAFGKPEIRVSADGTEVWARTPLTGGTAAAGAPIAVTVTDPGRAATFETALGAAPAGAADAAARGGLGWALVLALLGGLILNVMPCVLPVLSLKVAGALQKREAGAAAARAGFLATAAGVVVSMWVVAAATLALQTAGATVGWGLQFQQPGFLAFMAAVTALFAANLAGLFEAQAPSWLATRAAEMGGRGGLAGDFAAGAFATLLATPCSAPFLGSAVAYALTGSALDVAVIFTALGIGLAAPYLALAARPAAIRALPRPGPWMGVVKLALAALLGATSLWLLSVLAAAGGPAAAATAAAALALTLALIALRRRLPARLAPRLGAAAALGVVAAVAAPAMMGPQTQGPASAYAAQGLWADFDRGAIARRVAAGEVVLVDVTADWCLTCKANKALVLDVAPVVDALATPGVTAMRADWTRPDPAIARYLSEHNRFGIPFNAVYGPAAPDGLPLPELLSAQAVLDAVAVAGGASDRPSAAR